MLSLDLSGAALYLESKVHQWFGIQDPYNAKKFMSINAHDNGRLYPRDDLEAFGYMIYFLLNHGLPKPPGNAPLDVHDTDIKAGKKEKFLEVCIHI